MKVSCDVIRDLLPLYAEDLTSQASNEMVDEHLCECDECTRQLGVMKKAAQAPMDVEVTSLKRVGKTIRRRRILAVATAILLIVTLVLGGTLLLDARIYLDAEDAVEYTKQMEDGSIYVQLNNWPVGTGGAANDEETVNHGVIAWTNLRKLLFYPKERPSYEETDPLFQSVTTREKYEYMGGMRIGIGDAEKFNVWYVNASDGTAETLLWDGGEDAPEKPLANVNYHLAYYCLILVAGCILLIVPARKFREKWYGELCARFSILFACISLSTVIVSAGQFMEIWGEFTENFRDGLILAIPMTLTVLFARQLHKLSKQDKGL